mmetsp:Transcript_60587/g.141108  ORF Transcript_60587/g.141108 Transcript_60587/m.141108 type:complete len:247 (+) Transcript_60587:597-1337(+)
MLPLRSPLSPRSRSRSMPKAAPKRSEPPRSRGPSLELPPNRSRPPLPRESPPFSLPLLPPCAILTTRFLPSSEEPCRLSAFWACSSVRKVTKQTPLEPPSGLRKTFKRSTSPTSSKNDLISSSTKSPTLATKTCFGLGSRGAIGSRGPPLSPPFGLPLPLPRPLPPPMDRKSKPSGPPRSKSSRTLLLPKVLLPPKAGIFPESPKPKSPKPSNKSLMPSLPPSGSFAFALDRPAGPLLLDKPKSKS